jgi:hypothetical protein
MARRLARPFSKLVAGVTPAKCGDLGPHPGTAPKENKSVRASNSLARTCSGDL